MDVTRRRLARMLASSAAVTAVAAAQTAVQPGTDEESTSAREVMSANAQQLAKIKIPIETEPAFHFKA